MPKKSLTIEHALYLAAMLLAIALRLIELGSQPLSEFEAGWAMQAFDLQNGAQGQIGSQPLYVIFTSLLFNLAGSSEFLARLLPFIAGTMLVTLPYFYRNQLGAKTALLLTVGLAIDPTLVGLSRLAGSSITAVAFSLAALTAWFHRSARSTGIFAALAVLSGPAILPGIFSLALAWALVHFLLPGFESPFQPREPTFTRPLTLSFVISLLVAGTFFLRFPQGLSALGLTIPDYFSGWWTPSGSPLSQFWLSLLAYQLLALVFAAVSVWRAWGQPIDALNRWLSLWLFASLLLTLSNPSRHPGDLIWVLFPLWALAARYISPYLRWSREDGIPAWGQAALTVLLLTFLMMSTIRLASFQGASAILTSFTIFGRLFVLDQQTISLASIIALGVVSTLLIGAGWSSTAAARGLVWGSAAVLFIYTLAAAWSPLKNPHQPERELWFPLPGAANVVYLSEYIGDFSEFSTGLRSGIEVYSTHGSHLLHWELRLFPQARFVATLSEDLSPAALITGLAADQPRLAAHYRGQSISLLRFSLWDQLSSYGWQRWLLFREVPTQNENVILWVRSDIFPEDYSLRGETLDLPEWIAP